MAFVPTRFKESFDILAKPARLEQDPTISLLRSRSNTYSDSNPRTAGFYEGIYGREGISAGKVRSLYGGRTAFNIVEDTLTHSSVHRENRTIKERMQRGLYQNGIPLPSRPTLSTHLPSLAWPRQTVRKRLSYQETKLLNAFESNRQKILEISSEGRQPLPPALARALDPIQAPRLSSSLVKDTNKHHGSYFASTGSSNFSKATDALGKLFEQYRGKTF
jgi:hypothetical protein